MSYPIVYRVTTLSRIGLIFFGIFFCTGAFGLVFRCIENPFRNAQINLIFCVLAIGLIAVGVYQICSATYASLTLWVDAVEIRKPLGARKYRLDEIAGRRRTTGPGGRYPVIVTKGGRSISLDSAALGLDRRFWDWFNELPDVSTSSR